MVAQVRDDSTAGDADGRCRWTGKRRPRLFHCESRGGRLRPRLLLPRCKRRQAAFRSRDGSRSQDYLSRPIVPENNKPATRSRVCSFWPAQSRVRDRRHQEELFPAALRQQEDFLPTGHHHQEAALVVRGSASSRAMMLLPTRWRQSSAQQLRIA